MIFIQELDLPIPPYQEERKTKILNAKNNKLIIDDLTHMTSKKNGFLEGNTYQVLF